MRIVRYAQDGAVHYGALDGDKITRLRHAPFGGVETTAHVDELAAVRILAPLDAPRVFGLAYNYVAHVTETAHDVPEIPVLFMKPSTAVVGPDEPIVYPRDGELVHFEGELVVVIGREARHVAADDALDYVLGFTCGNDVSDRITQRREAKFGCLLAGKGHDTFAPLGPAIATDLDPANLRLTTRVNGEPRQDANTGDLLFSVRESIAYLSRFMTLLPGDAIMTGTPAGVGPIVPGDVVEVEIEGIGVLRNPVVAQAVAEARAGAS